MEEPPFYGHDIYRDREEAYVKNLLSKYKNDRVTEELKQKIWDELQIAKHEGKVTIPFKVVMRRDIYGKYPEHVEIILDTKV